MTGEEFGWVALDGMTIFVVLLQIILIVMIPGFLLSLAVFPKRAAMAMSERLALSFGLGLTPPFILMLLNVGLEVRVNFITSLLAFLFVAIVSAVIFLNRGGTLDLVSWYKSTGAAASE